MTPGLPYLYPSLEWMRDHTPRTTHYMEPEKRPEYGVLADFSFGHWITAIGERPNFANPFSLAPWHEKPIFDSARFFLAEEEGPLVASLERLRLRYVLLYNNENAIPDYARLTGKPVEDFLRTEPGGKRATPTPRFFRTFGVHLTLADGSEYQAAGETVPALSSFRLVHESPETRPRFVPGLPAPVKVSWVKIFERVKGARIEGRTDPHAVVTLEVPVDTDAGRSFEYRTRTTGRRRRDLRPGRPLSFRSLGGHLRRAGQALRPPLRAGSENLRRGRPQRRAPDPPVPLTRRLLSAGLLLLASACAYRVEPPFSRLPAPPPRIVPPSAASNLIVNGGFEDAKGDDPAGWTDLGKELVRAPGSAPPGSPARRRGGAWRRSPWPPAARGPTTASTFFRTSG